MHEGKEGGRVRVEIVTGYKRTDCGKRDTSLELHSSVMQGLAVSSNNSTGSNDNRNRKDFWRLRPAFVKRREKILDSELDLCQNIMAFCQSQECTHSVYVIVLTNRQNKLTV